MELIEVIVIAGTVIFLLSLLSVYLYKKKKHLPMGDCASCHSKNSNLLQQYNKKYYPQGKPNKDLK